nr:L-idonate 5-dehydrogenase [Spelaeicoccus albus]
MRVEDVPYPTLRPGEVIVRMEWGGICGSDLSYWKHGSTGTATLTEPMVLGHEVAGRIAEVAGDVAGLEVGQPVTVHPATIVPGQQLPERLAGRDNLYPEVRYFGSAAFSPHEQGGFAEYRAVAAGQIRALPDGVNTRQGAVAEPLGVAVHAINRAGGVARRRVLVNGSGPIGALVAAAARRMDAASVIVADLAEASLDVARTLGVDRTVNVAAGEALPEDVDVTFEASGAPASLGAVFNATGRGGVVVQVGNVPSGAVSAELAAIVTREIEYRGTYRFVDEISDALDLLAGGLDVEPLLTHSFPIDDAAEAFAVAGDRSTGSSKVMLQLS